MYEAGGLLGFRVRVRVRVRVSKKISISDFECAGKFLGPVALIPRKIFVGF